MKIVCTERITRENSKELWKGKSTAGHDVTVFCQDINGETHTAWTTDSITTLEEVSEVDWALESPGITFAEYKPTGTRIRSDLNKDLNILAATLERTKQDLMEEAIIDLLKKYAAK